MLNLMKLMRRYEFYAGNIPSHSLTHPGTDERITYMDALLQTTHTKKGTHNNRQSEKEYIQSLMFGDKNLDSSLHYFQNDLQKNPDSVDSLYKE